MLKSAEGLNYCRGKRRTQLEQWQDDLIASFEMRLYPVTKAIADRWAVLAAQAQRKGITLANIDGLIAATALEYDSTLVTRNVKDFAGVEVPLFNPWEFFEALSTSRRKSLEKREKCGS